MASPSLEKTGAVFQRSQCSDDGTGHTDPFGPDMSGFGLIEHCGSALLLWKGFCASSGTVDVLYPDCCLFYMVPLK